MSWQRPWERIKGIETVWGIIERIPWGNFVLTAINTWLASVWAQASSAPAWAVLLITMSAALLSLLCWMAFGQPKVKSGAILDSRGNPVLGSKGSYVWYGASVLAACLFVGALYGMWSRTIPSPKTHTAVGELIEAPRAPEFAFAIPAKTIEQASLSPSAVQQTSSGDNSPNIVTIGQTGGLNAGRIESLTVNHADPPGILALLSEKTDELVAGLTPPVDADTIRVACLSGSDRSCAIASRLLMIFSRAGWRIQENKVFKASPDIPKEAITIVVPGQPVQGLPPHLGRWRNLVGSEKVVALALNKAEIPVRFSSATDMSEGTIGVYAGLAP